MLYCWLFREDIFLSLTRFSWARMNTVHSKQERRDWGSHVEVAVPPPQGYERPQQELTFSQAKTSWFLTCLLLKFHRFICLQEGHEAGEGLALFRRNSDSSSLCWWSRRGCGRRGGECRASSLPCTGLLLPGKVSGADAHHWDSETTKKYQVLYIYNFKNGNLRLPKQMKPMQSRACSLVPRTLLDPPHIYPC